MAKKIRFPLEMEHGVEVRSIEELKENFSLARILVYISNGKMVTWLRDRYADDIADAIEALNVNDEGLPKKVCAIFDVEYDEQAAIDLEKAEERNRKLGILKEHTTEQKFLSLVDNVAFDQNDMYDLMDEGETVIYLCGDRFSIPLSKKGMTYIGVNNPIAVIDSKVEVNWSEREIILTDVTYDDKYQSVLKVALKKEDIDEKEIITREKNSSSICMGGYSNKSYLNFMLSPTDKKQAEELYLKLKDTVQEVHYYDDRNIRSVRDALLNAGIAGLAENYINSL